MHRTEHKIAQVLNEAHASEVALVRVLQTQIAMTPRGRLRTALETHRDETRDHAARLRRRLDALGARSSPAQLIFGAAETAVGQMLALAKTPVDLLRGTGGEEQLLKNAKDAVATEALEIATYTAIEALAREVDDERTASLAASIRADEERMLDRLLREIPTLTKAVVRADVRGRPSFDPTTTGAADAVRTVRDILDDAARTVRDRTTAVVGDARDAVDDATRDGAAAVRNGAGAARDAVERVPGAQVVTGAAGGLTADASDLPIARYDELNVDDIADRLDDLSPQDLATIDIYERRHKGRTGVLQATERRLQRA
ncbi:MAG: ferritin-like domain-containing protein [Solirubrobacteraceae bacterium]|nr:ferritin-like domain-containing protein [Solirubrobacteraceae bacterium]